MAPQSNVNPSTAQALGMDPNTISNLQNPYNSQPLRPNYIAAYDPNTMSLTDYLSGKYDHSGFDQFKSEAMRRGPSAWANLATADQAFQANTNREKGAAQVNAQTAQAQDELAARGGLSSGARERAATEGSKNYISMAQDNARTETGNKLQIGMNDEQNRIQELSQVPGMEGQQASLWENAKAQDVANTANENERRNAYNQNVYHEQMQGYMANQQANATMNSGKK